jgi:hypothetical protein
MEPTPQQNAKVREILAGTNIKSNVRVIGAKDGSISFYTGGGKKRLKHVIAPDGTHTPVSKPDPRYA